MFRRNLPEDIIKFLLLIVVTIIVTYSGSKILASVWYITTLVLYYRSKDEAFWLAYYLVTVDGFMGFLGVYTVTLEIIPELPAIELAQFYILLTLIKTIRIRNPISVFYGKYAVILLFYIFFMIIWGRTLSTSGDVRDYFRILKLVLPFILFYSIPRLFSDIKTYERFFSFVFIVAILAFLTQLFTLLTGLSPAAQMEITEEQVAEAGAFRGFYNVAATLLGLFGSLFFLAFRDSKRFSRMYLFIVIISAFGMALLSATRGWILSFGFVIILTMLFTGGIKLKWRMGFILLTIVMYITGMSNQAIRQQVLFSTERVMALEAIAKGDITAGGTVHRLDIRSPKVMKIWKQNPVFGWGFSDISRKYGDQHVGNQTLLMTTGIVGFALLTGFLLFFSFKMLTTYWKASPSVRYRNVFIIFIIFLAGWFFIHSTSGQHFNYQGIPDQIIPQALFFSLGAFMYSKFVASKKSEEKIIVTNVYQGA